MPTRAQFNRYAKTPEGRIALASLGILNGSERLTWMRGQLRLTRYNYICGAARKNGSICKRRVDRPDTTCSHHGAAWWYNRLENFSATGALTIKLYRHYHAIVRDPKQGHPDINYHQHPLLILRDELVLISNYWASQPKPLRLTLFNPWVGENKHAASSREYDHYRSLLSYERRRARERGEDPEDPAILEKIYASTFQKFQNYLQKREAKGIPYTKGMKENDLRAIANRRRAP